jgi:hypothetical protein
MDYEKTMDTCMMVAIEDCTSNCRMKAFNVRTDYAIRFKRMYTFSQVFTRLQYAVIRHMTESLEGEQRCGHTVT